MSVMEPHAEKLKYIFDNARVGIAICNAENNTLEMVNPAFAAIHGYEPHELIGVSPSDVFAPECMQRLQEHENAIGCAIDDVSFETTHIRKDGSQVSVSVHITVIKDENGVIIQRIANIQDISERQALRESNRVFTELFDKTVAPIKQHLNEIHSKTMFEPNKMSNLLLTNMLKKLNASEREMRTLANNISAILIRFDRKCRFLYVNQRFKMLMGMGLSDLRGKKPTDIPELPDTEFFEQTILRIVETGVSESFEHDAILPDGSRKTAFVNITPEFDDEGNVAYVQFLTRDITEQKQMESALKIRELEFRSLAENTPDNIARLDCEGRYLYINPVHERTLGKTASEIIGSFIPDNHKAVKTAIAQVVATGEKITVLETTPSQDGRTEYHEVSLVPERDTSGQIISVLGIGRDITERKYQEELLQQKEQEFRNLAENIPGFVYRYQLWTDGKEEFLYVSNGIINAYGITPETALTNIAAVREVMHPDDIAHFKAAIATSAQTMQPFHAEFRVNHPKKGLLWLESRSTPNLQDNGSIIWHGITLDITVRKQMQKQIIDSEIEFRNLAENSPNIIMRYDLECRRIYVNKAYAHHTGIPVNMAINTTPSEKWNMRMLSMSAEEYQAKIKHVIETGKQAKFGADWYRLSDGGFVALDLQIVAQRGANGKIIGALAIGHDVTERKEIEKQLLEQNRFLESLLDAIPVPIFLKDKETRYKGFNKAFEEFYGKNKEDLIGKGVFDIFSHDQAQVFFDADADLFRNGGTQTYEAQLQDARGVDHTVMFHKAIYFDEAGEAIGQIGTILDITERKQQEERLHKVRAKLSAVISSIPDLIWVKDAEGVYMMCNPPFANFFGVPEDEITGKTDYDFFESDAADICKLSDLEAIAVNTLTLSYETFTNPHSGAKGTWEVRKIPVYNGEEFMGVLGIWRDITERKKMESEITKQKDFQNTLLLGIAESGLGIHVIEDGQYVYTNDIQKAKKYGYDETFCEVKPNFLETIHPDDRAKALDMYTRRLRGEDVPTTYELGFVQTDGERREHSVSVIVIPNTDPLQTIVVTHDISERKQIEQLMFQNESRLKEAQKIAKVGSWELEFPGLELSWSEEIYRIFELDPNVFHPSYDHFLNAIHPEDRLFIDAAYADALKNKTPYDIVHRLAMSDGRIKYVHERGETLYNEEGDPIRSIGTVQDISEQKVIEKKIEHMAHHDALTGLPNRTLAQKRAEQIIAHAKRSKSKAAFLFIDLDGFKAINDTLGHSAGDSMLKTIASRLKECVRENDIISRQGGDEFLLILSDLKEENIIASTTEKILSELEKSFEINDHTLSISGSIGISLYPDHGETFDSLLQSADTAMYKAKETGKNGYCFFNQQMMHNIVGQFKIQNDLKNALENNEFVLFYQPQIDLATNGITGVEALIRWNHPQLGMVPPMQFIPLAESSGLIVQIGQWVIEEACRQAALWQKMEIDISVAVNISAMQFKRGNLEEIVKNALLSSKIDPKWLELELTESIIMHDADNTLQSVRNLKSLGVQLSIDDFGTGYSSLAYLKRFAVDKLKIDQSFVRDILQDRDDAAIVKTIIQMAKNLNLKTIAEGVEDAQVLSVIDAYGCDEVQGYHFAKPMPANEFEHYHANFYNSEA